MAITTRNGRVAQTWHVGCETGRRRLSDRFAEYLRSASLLRDILMHTYTADLINKQVNTANHSISDMKVCAINLLNWNHSSPRAQRTIFFHLIPS